MIPMHQFPTKEIMNFQNKIFFLQWLFESFLWLWSRIWPSIVAVHITNNIQNIEKEHWYKHCPGLDLDARTIMLVSRNWGLCHVRHGFHLSQTLLVIECHRLNAIHYKWFLWKWSLEKFENFLIFKCYFVLVSSNHIFKMNHFLSLGGRRCSLVAIASRDWELRARNWDVLSLMFVIRQDEWIHDIRLTILVSLQSCHFLWNMANFCHFTRIYSSKLATRSVRL